MIKKITLLFILSSLTLGGVILNADTQSRRKAKYYYSAGIQSEALGSSEEAYEYFKKAYQSDPTYEEGAQAFGIRRLYNNIDTLQTIEELQRSLDMMKPYVDKYPADLYESLNYGYVAGQLDRTDDAVSVLERTYELRPESTQILLQLSDVYAQAYDLHNAIDAISSYENLEGMSAALTTRKLSYLLSDNDTVRAINEAHRLMQSDTTDASYKILAGNLFDILEKPDSAIYYYERAEQLDPESGEAKFALASFYRQQGDSVKYDNKIYEVLLSEDLDMTQKADLLAEYLESLLRGNHDSARGDYLFSVLRSQYPHEALVLDLSARYNAAKGNIDEAVEEISYAIDQNPTNAAYWGQLMTYQAAGDKPEEALETYKKAQSHIELDNNFKLGYASIALMLEKYDLAIDTFKGIIADLDPSLAADSLFSLNDVRRDISMRDLDLLSSMFSSLGDAYHESGKIDESYRAYENAITFNSSNLLAKNNYAYFLTIDGSDLDKAFLLSKEVIEKDTEKSPTYLDTYAWVCFKKGDYEEALKFQEQALEIASDTPAASAELYDHYGDILFALDRVSDALEAWQQAIRIHQENGDPETEINPIEIKIKERQQ